MYDKTIKIMMIDNDPAAHCYHEAMIKKAGLNLEQVYAYLDANSAILDLKNAVEEGASDCVPDVILIDINMPDIDGWAFVEEIKKMNLISKVPKIYMVSNSLDPVDRIKVNSTELIKGFKQKFLDIEFFKSLS